MLHLLKIGVTQTPLRGRPLNDRLSEWADMSADQRPYHRDHRDQRGLRFTARHQLPFTVLITLTTLSTLVACGGNRVPDPPTSDLPPGNHELSLEHGGRARLAIVHVPPAAGSDPLPLVIAFHGGGGEAEGFQGYAGLDAIADREGFLVVYPFGTGALPRTLLTWNSGVECCGFARQNQIDDVGFALALVDRVAAHTQVDPRRIYATGHSNGAMMSYRLAAEAAARIAAIVPVAGAMDLATFAPARAVPVLHIHSVDDPRALYEGGLGPPFPLTTQRVNHQPVSRALAQWASRNGCSTTTSTLEERTGTGTNSGQTATRISYAPCSSNAPVEHWRLTGSGHGWPGNTDIGLREELIGPPTTLINAAEEAWGFLRRFVR
jgi:polyhydroxybutyrate depolymerase